MDARLHISITLYKSGKLIMPENDICCLFLLCDNESKVEQHGGEITFVQRSKKDTGQNHYYLKNTK